MYVTNGYDYGLGDWNMQVCVCNPKLSIITE